jgi:hypothetical protein
MAMNPTSMAGITDFLSSCLKDRILKCPRLREAVIQNDFIHDRILMRTVDIDGVLEEHLLLSGVEAGKNTLVEIHGRLIDALERYGTPEEEYKPSYSLSELEQAQAFIDELSCNQS